MAVSRQLRFFLEVTLIVVVAVVVAIAHASTAVIVVAIGAAWTVVAIVEWRLRGRDPVPQVTGRAKFLQWAGTAASVAALPFLVLGRTGSIWWLCSLALTLLAFAFFIAARRARGLSSEEGR